MKDTDWEIIYELYKLPNITKVANKLYMTQPSLTKRLQSIENEFHIKIVDRTPKGVKFTPEGKLLAGKALKYMDFIKETKKEMQLYRHDMTGTIYLGSAYSYQKEILNDIVIDYARKHPRTNLEITNGPSSSLYRRVCNKDLDAAFVQGEYGGPVHEVKVCKYKAYIMSKGPIKLKDLENMPMIEYRSNDKSKEPLNNWWLQHFKQLPSVIMTVVYIDFAWQLVAKGMGFTLCFLPEGFSYPGVHLTPMLTPDNSFIERNTCFIYNDPPADKIELLEFIAYVKKNMAIA